RDHGDLRTEEEREPGHRDEGEAEAGDGLGRRRERDDQRDRDKDRSGHEANRSGIDRAASIASSSRTSAATMFDSAPALSDTRVPSTPSATRPRSLLYTGAPAVFRPSNHARPSAASCAHRSS